MPTFPINIVYQADQWLLIDKPPGLSVHNNEDAQNLLSILNDKLKCKLYAVHRLDKATSGLMLLAHTPQMTAVLQRALQTATKTYEAIVRGVPSPHQGVWTQSISNKSEGRRNPRGKTKLLAQTTYQLLSHNQHLAKIQCTIQTGRQHQIRKHCVLNRHEILGDSRYGDPKYQTKMKRRFGDFTMCLQAKSLRFSISTKDFSFCAPEREDWLPFGV